MAMTRHWRSQYTQIYITTGKSTWPYLIGLQDIRAGLESHRLAKLASSPTFNRREFRPPVNFGIDSERSMAPMKKILKTLKTVTEPLRCNIHMIFLKANTSLEPKITDLATIFICPNEQYMDKMDKATDKMKTTD